MVLASCAGGWDEIMTPPGACIMRLGHLSLWSNDQDGTVCVIDDLRGRRSEKSIDDAVAVRAHHDQLGVVLLRPFADRAPGNADLCVLRTEDMGRNSLRESIDHAMTHLEETLTRSL